MNKFFIMLLTVWLIGCAGGTTQEEPPTQPTQVRLTTTLGEIVIELSDKTPQHRDNFIKLVEEGKFDSLLFHRVIQGFVVQGGDPESKDAAPGDTLGSGDLGYTVPAEFDTSLYHKRGAVGAARDGNPERASSAIQFYVVQAANPLPDSVIDRAEVRINDWLREHYSLNDEKNQIWKDSLSSITNAEKVNRNAYRAVRDTLRKLAKGYVDFATYQIPESHREVYRELGGTPFLDQNYTVFGEVILGMDVVDAIAAMETSELDRPLEDVRILSARVVK